MKRVLIIGADFTPSSYPPALMIRFFAKHLPEFGWQPTIVTTDPQYYEWSVDPENQHLLPGWLEVIRTPALSAKLTRKIGIGDIGIRSLWHHWRTADQICKSGNVDLVFIPGPPFYTMVLGRLINERYGIPYVIDYIDPWVTDYWKKLPKEERLPKRRLSDKLSRILEPFALRYVGHIVSVDTSYTDGVVARYPWINETDTTGIPYGGEPADFDYLCENPRRNHIFNNKDGLLHISYVGRGGPDMVPALRSVFQAVKYGLDRSHEIFSKLRMHFIGTTYAHNANGLYQVLPVAEEMGVQEYVDEHPGRVSYLDALQIMLDSHALLALGSESIHYTASKIFPYILSKRPLMAIFHKASSVVNILHETGAGKVITFDSESRPIEKAAPIAKYLEELLRLSAGYSPSTDWKSFEPYTTRAMAGRLACAFNKVLENK